MVRLKVNFVNVHAMPDGTLFIVIPKKIAVYNKITKGCIIKWSDGYGFPHIERIINPLSGRDVKLVYESMR